MHAATFAVVRAYWRGATVVAFVLAAFETVSCVKEPSLDELAAQRVVLTQFVSGTSFSSFKTFAITETIPIVTQQGDFAAADTVTRDADPAKAATFIDATAAELEKRGYRRVTKTESPDVGVAITGVIRTQAVAIYGGWWGYGAAVPGYWGYGGFPLSSGAVSGGIAIWNDGAVVIEMFDLRAARDATAKAATTTPISAANPSDGGTLVDGGPADAGPSATLPVVWSAILYGVVTDIEATTPPIKEMQQAFTQSPYLGTSETP